MWVGDTVRRPVEARITAHAKGIRDNAAAGDGASGRLPGQGVPDALNQAIAAVQVTWLVVT